MSKCLKDQEASFTSFSIKRCLCFILKIIKKFPRSVQDNELNGSGEIQNWLYLKKNQIIVLFGMAAYFYYIHFDTVQFFFPNAQSILNLSVYSRVISV